MMTTPQAGRGVATLGQLQGPVPGRPYYDLTVAPRPVTVSADAVTADSQLVTGAGLILAVTFSEASGSSHSQLQLFDGTGDTNTLIAVFGGESAQSTALGVPLPGIPFDTGLFLHIVSGAASLTVTYVPLYAPLQ